jgi:hypothetical protein
MKTIERGDAKENTKIGPESREKVPQNAEDSKKDKN